ncbi:MAG: MmcQ/YjbR family DNA-binding protein [Christensenellales bacterium]|nr:MmcQ/YjbR family DNA-binding protein [Christensenellales bacterium]
MNRNDFLEFCREIAGCVVDQPFQGDSETSIARHRDTGKWFAAVLKHQENTLVNLKCEPLESEFLQSVYNGIRPAYHMNKRHWISIYLGSDVPDELLEQLTRRSFALTDRHRVRISIEEY